MTRLRRPISLAALALITVLWSSALIAAPSAVAPALSAVVYAAGSVVCHQRPERSFHRDGAQYPVCARCLGLYVGAIGGVLGWAVVAGVRSMPHMRATRNPWLDLRRGLIATALPTALTVLTATAGWWDPSNAVRAALAFPLGASIAAIVAAVAAGDLR